MAYESVSDMASHAYSVLHVPPYHPREITELIVSHYITALLSFHTTAMVITIIPDPPTVSLW